MRARYVLLLLSLAVVGVAGGGALLAGGGEPREPAAPPKTVAAHPTEIPANVRTVTVWTTMPMPSARARRLSAMLEEGAMPSKPMMAEVLSDTDCTPDEDMVSRCRNEMRLENGRTIVLRHPHDMRAVPCLAPGEQVRLIPGSV